ncbi:hypothetical protein MC885_020556 [Smutsia gigantea]|nr:hypothetical protein MC885_020556 [Smutsia gigantea]
MLGSQFTGFQEEKSPLCAQEALAMSGCWLPHLSWVYMDCKSRSVDISLAHCTASLIKAMKYCGNPDLEKHIFFESVSAAISNIYRNKNLSKLSDHTEV